MIKLQRRSRHRAHVAVLGAAAVLAGLGGALYSSVAGAAPLTAPANTGEPTITGNAMVGFELTSSTGAWTGSDPMTFTYRWLRCDAAGSKPDGSDCMPINATKRTYDVRTADVGFRLRVRVTASNSDGSASVASNATSVVVRATPVNVDRPSISGSAVVGNRLQANRGSWTGVTPMTYAFRWLRCNSQGDQCDEIAGATDSDYVVADRDVGRTLRVRVTARNARGSASAVSAPTGLVTTSPPPGSSISVNDVPRTERLIVSEVRFSPSPVTSRTAPITVAVRVKDTRGYVVRGALVFVRSTPRVTTGGDRQSTDASGWVTYQLIPTPSFTLRPDGNLQFFVKAYRTGDPPLAGVAGYRLVQVAMD